MQYAFRTHPLTTTYCCIVLLVRRMKERSLDLVQTEQSGLEEAVEQASRLDGFLNLIIRGEIEYPPSAERS